MTGQKLVSWLAWREHKGLNLSLKLQFVKKMMNQSLKIFKFCPEQTSCGSVGRAAAFKTRGLQFYSHCYFVSH